MALDIHHDRDAKHFTVDVDGQHCELEYTLAGAVMTIVHTRVPEAVGGRGIAAALMHTAFDTARSEGWKIIPACSYATLYARKHAEYADLMI
jgi:predicted GNAT family acetyltransferase